MRALLIGLLLTTCANAYAGTPATVRVTTPEQSARAQVQEREVVLLEEVKEVAPGKNIQINNEPTARKQQIVKKQVAKKQAEAAKRKHARKPSVHAHKKPNPRIVVREKRYYRQAPPRGYYYEEDEYEDAPVVYYRPRMAPPRHHRVEPRGPYVEVAPRGPYVEVAPRVHVVPRAYVVPSASFEIQL
jgi:hypothetical protein